VIPRPHDDLDSAIPSKEKPPKRTGGGRK